MTGKYALKKTAKRLNIRKVDKTTTYSAFLGKPPKTVKVPNRKDYHYARIRKNLSEIVQVYNLVTSAIYDLPVRIAFRNNRWEVIGYDTGLYGSGGGDNSIVGKHGGSHLLGQGDAIYLDTRQIVNSLVYSLSTGVAVHVNSGFVNYHNSIIFVKSQTVDLTDYSPTGSGAIWGIIRASPSGTVDVQNDMPYVENMTLLNNFNIPDIDYGYVGLAAVKLWYGQTVLDRRPSSFDLVDLRYIPDDNEYGGVDVALPLSKTGDMLYMGGDATEGDEWQINVSPLPAGTTNHDFPKAIDPYDSTYWESTGSFINQSFYFTLAGWPTDNIYGMYILQSSTAANQGTSFKIETPTPGVPGSWTTVVTDTISGAEDTISFSSLVWGASFKFTLLGGGAGHWIVYTLKFYKAEGVAGGLSRLPIGSAGQILASNGSTPEWRTNTGTSTGGGGGGSSILVYDDNTFKTTGTALHFNDGLVVRTTGTSAWIDWTGSSSGGGHVIQDEGVAQTQRTNFNFIGDGFVLWDDAGNDATIVSGTSIPGTPGAPGAQGEQGLPGGTTIIYDDSEYKVSGTAINFGTNLNVAVTGSIAYVDWTGSSGGGTDLYGVCNGRLTLTSGTAITTSDVTAATAIYFNPYKGNQIGLYNGASWDIITFDVTPLSLAGTSGSSVYDIFGYNDGGVLTLELAGWTNDTIRATALTSQDGIYVKTGATTRRYLGTIRINATGGQCEDSLEKRFVWNYYNRAEKILVTPKHATAWTYNVNSWRMFANSNTYRVMVVVGIEEDILDMKATCGIHSAEGALAIGIDSENTPDYTYTHIVWTRSNSNTSVIWTEGHLKKPLSAGFHYIQLLEISNNGTVTFWSYGGAGGFGIFKC